jgi:hypothetical protein
MLDAVALVLPQGGHGWAKVASHFNQEETTTCVRDSDSIKRKFISLKNHKKPTGDPECPPEVVRAKRLQREIDNKASVVTLDDEQAGGEQDPPDIDTNNYESDAPGCSSDDGLASERNTEEGPAVTEPLPQQPASPEPRRVNTPGRRASSEKPNRVGLSQAALASMGRALAGTQGGTPSNNSAGMMSYVAKRRQKLDRFIDRCDESENTSAGSTNQLMALMMMMDERAAARQADRDDRERQFQLELARREDEREERRAEREARNTQMQMLMMARIFGTANPNSDQTSSN